MNRERDAVVVGSGPNGLAAAIELAKSGRSVLVLEGEDQPGGGSRSAELTLPGFTHDVCSSIHPLGAASPFFRSLPLADLGLRWIHPPAPLAHPLDDGSAAVIERSVDDTAAGLGPDGPAWKRTFGPLVAQLGGLLDDVLAPPAHLPRSPLVLARFASRAARPATMLARRFSTDAARALIAGMAAHSVQPLSRMLTGPIAVLFGLLAHGIGWPVAEGGSQRITDALVAHLRSLGGDVATGRRVRTVGDVPGAPTILFDVTPRQLARIAGEALPPGYQSLLARFRYGPGAFKVDWALDGPIPWAADACGRAATVHIGGTMEEIAGGEEAVWRGEHPDRPFVILAQPSLFDPTRAPPGRHTAWAYCHVPNGSTTDMTERIEAQVERFAPGFRQRVLARSVMAPADIERHNENNIGGDISGGAQTLGQLLARPVPRTDPYATPNPAIFMCSSSTPPGAGVHGMCGYHAARSALRRRS
ncbi:MAG: phytoene desaturase family protein [Actinomycetota bacterium]